MERENKKNDKIAKLLGIIIGIILIIGISYGLFQIVLTGKKTNKIVTGTLKLDIVETSEENPLKYTNIELNNAYPMTNEEGLETKPYTFTLKNTGSIDAKYEICLSVLKTSTLSDNMIKFAIRRQVGELESAPMLLSETQKLETVDNDNNEVYLYSLDEGTIDVGESIDYKLNLWVDYDANNDAMNKEMTAKIWVNGFQKNK